MRGIYLYSVDMGQPLLLKERNTEKISMIHKPTEDLSL